VDACEEARRVVGAVCALSERVRLDHVEHDEPGPWPQTTIGDGLVYRGMPVGYELATLVHAIAEAGRRTSGLSAAARQRLATLGRPVELRVYVTPT
jgi:alkyl hydroperoxide reductase subunit AhpF